MHGTRKIISHDQGSTFGGGHNPLSVVFLYHSPPPSVRLFILSLIWSELIYWARLADQGFRGSVFSELGLQIDVRYHNWVFTRLLGSQT